MVWTARQESNFLTRVFLALWEARGTVRVGTEVTYLRYCQLQCGCIQGYQATSTLRASVRATRGVSLVWQPALAKQLNNKQQGLRVNTAKVYFAFTPSALIMM